MRLIKISLQELFGARRFLLFFLINLSVGLSGLVIVEHFKIIFNENLETRSKNLLGADLSIGGRRILSNEKRNLIQENLDAESLIQSISIFSMANNNGKAKLIYVSSYHKNYPYYGGLTFKSGKKTPGRALLHDQIWVYPEVLIQLGLKIGDKLKIGSSYFLISDVVEDDTSQTFEMGAIAPKVIMTNEGISKAKLISKGSTAYYRTYYKTRKSITKDLETKVTDIVNDTSYRVVTPKKSSDQVGRAINYLTDFLGLVSIVALMLSLIGIFYLYRSLLAKKRKSFAVMKTLGLTSKEILQTQLIGLFVLAILGCLGSLSIALLALPIIEQVIASVIPLGLDFSIRPQAIFISTFISVVSVILVGVPLLKQSLSENASSLFQEEINSLQLEKKINLVYFLPLILFAFSLSVWMGQSIKIGGIFTLSVGLILAFIYPILNFSLAKGEKLFKGSSLEFKLGLRYLCRYRFSTISIFLALLFGSLLINFIPALQQSIQLDIQGGDEKNNPSLFLFDIQEEQKEEVEKFILNKGKKILGMSPMIRARLTKINGEEIKVDVKNALTREEERARRFRNRGVNLSYREELNPSEKIIKGKKLVKFSGDGIPGISLEKRYAKRLGVNIGDKLTFDIMGIDQEGIVQNIRHVRWTSFMPNFFISFPLGVLEDAPKTYLGAIGKMETVSKYNLQSELVRQFPNISSVDLERIITKVSQVMDQMSISLSVMSLLSIIVGLMVVFALSRNQIKERMKDLMLLKTLGLDLFRIKKMVFGEFITLSVLSTLLGATLGLILSMIASHLFFNGEWEFPVNNLLITLLGVNGLCLIVVMSVVRKDLQKKGIYCVKHLY